MQSAAEICSSPIETEAFIEFIFKIEKLKCKKCSHEFDFFQKKLLTGIDKILQHKNNLYGMQYQLAISLGILSSGDKAQCPKCGSGDTLISDELESK